MSGTLCRFSRLFVLPLAVSGLLATAGNIHAQLGQRPDDDLLDLVRRRQKVEMQKVEAEYRQAIKEAQTLTASAPQKAVEKLKTALAQMKEDTILPKDRREVLTQLFNDRIRSAEAAATRLAARKKEPPKTNPFSKKPNSDSPLSPRESVKKSPEGPNEPLDNGKVAEIIRERSQTAEHPTETPAAEARQTTAARTAAIIDARKLRKEQERNRVAVDRDMEKSAVGAAGDTEFPKDWRERTKGRTAGVQLTAKEKSILQALGSVISVDFQNMKLEDVVQYLQNATGQPILLDKEAMKELELSYESPVTLTVKGVTVRTILRRILADLGMTYVIRDESIQVTSAQRAKELMVTRRYYVGDLLAGMGALTPSASIAPAAPVAGVGGLPVVPLTGNFGLGTPPVVSQWNGFSPYFNQQVQNVLAQQQTSEQAKQVIDQLKEMIMNSVDTQSWREHGGNGTIVYHAPSMSFIIRQSAEVHSMLGAGLVK
jgi:hypothetical protein